VFQPERKADRRIDVRTADAAQWRDRDQRPYGAEAGPGQRAAQRRRWQQRRQRTARGKKNAITTDNPKNNSSAVPAPSARYKRGCNRLYGTGLPCNG
jgi:hypothetical protein